MPDHENEFARELDKVGRPLWDKILQDLIACVYLVPKEIMTERDKSIQIILICLHEAVQGKTDVHVLAQNCMLQTEITNALNIHHRN